MKPIKIVELVGLPGAGKTTLINTLRSQNLKILLARTPYFRNVTDIPFFLYNTLEMLPLFLRIAFSKDGGRLKLYDLALMLILNGWSRVLEQQVTASSPVLLLDEGPICYLTRLRAWGSAATKSSMARAWWEAMFQQWAVTLDLIIQLDTSNGILIERVRSREMWQEVKAMTDDQALDYFENLRSAQDYVLKEFFAQTQSEDWVCFDTWLNSPDQIYQHVARLLAH